jgi:FkbM family methyltransferase
MKSYSQIGQDINVLEYYNFKKNGYFIDIGASDGINESNTYLLEKEYNWNGICVEPIPFEYNKLIQNRNCICENKAVYNTSNIQVEFTICNISVLSGITQNIDAHNNLIDQYGINSVINVNTITLNDLLYKYNSPSFIDYISIDTEGSELEIIKSIDFSKYNFGIIHVEHNFITHKREQIKNILELNNYKYVKENKWDDIYVYKL